jgi:hypothetical protein
MICKKFRKKIRRDSEIAVLNVVDDERACL